MSRTESEDWAWDRYWRADRLASCAAGPGWNYQESLIKGWREFFASLPDGSDILDLCTGNGAIAVIAAGYAQDTGKNFDITAVDSADISPAEFVSREKNLLAGIHFQSRTSAEELPYGDNSFDAVTSQYGIEYADMSAAVDEAVRVLAPDGRLRFVVHAGEGYTVTAAQRDIAECDFLLEESGLFPLARQMFEEVCTAERAEGDLPPERIQPVEETIRRFRRTRQAVEARTAKAENPTMFQSTLSLMADSWAKRRHFPLETLLDKLAEAELEVRAHRRRLADMVAAALDAAEFEALAGKLGERGLTDIATGEALSDTDGALIGRTVVAVNPSR